MESNPLEALTTLIIKERKAMANESTAARKKSEGVAWGGTDLTEAIRATEFVPRLSEDLQQCAGCKRRIPGVTELVWTTVFFLKHCSLGRSGEKDDLRLCAECHALKVTFGLERRKLAQREAAEVAAVERSLNDGTMLSTDAATGRMDYQMLLCGPLEKKHVAARALDGEDLLVGHHGPRGPEVL